MRIIHTIVLILLMQMEAVYGVTNESRGGRGHELSNENECRALNPSLCRSTQSQLRRVTPNSGVIIFRNGELTPKVSPQTVDQNSGVPLIRDGQLSPSVVPPREVIEVATGEIESRCLYSWDDSHQVHSEDIILEWNYQKVKTTMKRLHHCIKLKVIGPIDVEGIGKEYVNKCIDYGLKKNSTRHALEAIIALGIDIWGGTQGAATAVKISDYLKSISDNTMECLTDTEKISSYVERKLAEKFDATVTPETEWIYWDL